MVTWVFFFLILGKFFLNVFLTIVLWSILMFIYGFLSMFVKRFNFLIY